MEKPRCFVAMAFGQGDTDVMYAGLYKRFKDRFKVRRVDRINHNNDIDDQILAELKEADLAIADLTYARPSVYFEAGYAQGRPIPVIYTSRHDHVGKAATDDARRVHFDLQMKNIITWKTPVDQEFWTQLDRRLGLVAAPLLRNRNQTLQLKQHQEQFASLSVYQQLEAIKAAAFKSLRGIGFRVSTDKQSQNDPAFNQGKRLGYAVRLNANGTLLCMTIWTFPSVRKTQLRAMRRFSPLVEGHPNLNASGCIPTRMDFITLILTPRNVPRLTIRDAYPTASFRGDACASYSSDSLYVPEAKFWKAGRDIKRFTDNHYHIGHLRCETNTRHTIDNTGSTPKRIGKSKLVKCTQSYCVISGIKSETSLKDQIAENLSTPN